MKQVVFGLVVVCSVFAMCGCGVRTEVEHDMHWSYEGETGPEHWGDLSPDYVLAKTGKQQSPIDITGTEKGQGKAFELDYKPTSLSLVNNGHAIEQEYAAGSVMTANGKSYELKQFHVHSPSEHTVEGKRFDMEVHLVHASADGELAVIGVLLNAGAENALLAGMIDRFPKEVGGEVKDDATMVNVADLLPANLSCYTYDGSLTTPPCSEGVEWFMLANPVELSAAQLAQFQEIFKGNYRPVQPLNGRKIMLVD